MRKLFVAIAVLGFMCNGCAWLGFGDDESSTTVAQAEPAHEEPAVNAENVVEKKPATTKKTNKKATKTSSKRGAKSEAEIKAELDKMGHKLASQSARTLLPNKANKEVKKVGNHWVATYIHVDTKNVTTELRPGANGQYVGFIRYQEEIMQCKGDTKQAALSAPCQKTGSRRLNELIRYDGKEWQD